MTKRAEEIITKAELEKLYTYSCTLPTSPKPGFCWKCDIQEPRRYHGAIPADTPEEWIIGEAYEIDEPGMVGIRWSWAMEAPGKVWRGDLSDG